MSNDVPQPIPVDPVRDTVEYLRFLRDLGVTHLGGAAASDAPVDVAPPTPVAPVVAPLSAPVSPPVAPSASVMLPDPPPVMVHPIAPPGPPPVSEPVDQPEPPISKPAMPKPPKQTSTAQSYLFGDLVPEVAPAAPLPSDTCLADIRADIGDCQRCKLAPTRTKIVFGDGNPTPDLVFVGEAPGADEDASGIPFVGRAGQLLNKIIEAIGMKREEVFIANVVKCRPPENRTPESDEIAACSGFLHRQLALLKPKVIVSLGAPAAFTLLGDRKLGAISKIRGQFYDYRGTPLMVTFHPAYLLRSPDKKREVWEDMKKVRDFLRGDFKP